MLLQPYKSDFILSTIKEVEAHKARNNQTLKKNSEVRNKEKNKDGKLKTILSIWCFKRKRLPDERLTKQKSILCEHKGMKQWGVNYWETYAPLVNWISVMSLLDNPV